VSEVYNRCIIFRSPTASAFLHHPNRTRGLFSAADYAQMRAFFAARRELRPTPLTAMPALAQTLGVGSLDVKDESGRFGLNAFKLLGARFAIETLIAEGEVRTGDTLVCASEGNHGRAVARAAREAGCASRCYMAHDAAPSRVEAIAGEGATVVKVDGTYDDAVRVLRDEAAVHGWTIISDTAWPGYERIPFLIMLGYTRMLEEIRDQGSGIGDQGGGDQWAADQGVTHLFVQGGVGGLLCAMASWCAFHHPETRVISVEPTTAACLQASARAGVPVAVSGELNTMMAGLRNREVSPPAFESLLPNVDAFVALDDAWTFDAMRELNEVGVKAGASGGAALGGVLALCRDANIQSVRDQLRIDRHARVLAIVSEGVTDSALWARVMAGS